MKTLFYNGPIHTMTPAGTAEALLMVDDRITAVGTLHDLEAQAGECTRVDLRGRALLPGFIDPHSHFFQVACAFLQVSLDGADSVEEMTRRIHAFMQENLPAPGAWVTARDYDNNIMPDLRHPTLTDLDRLCPDHPLVIHHKSGHMGLMNSLALQAVGVTNHTPDPEGGKFGRQDGQLTGYLEENAFFEAIKQIPMATPDDLLRGMEKAQETYASYGITTLQDGMVVKEMLPLYQLLRSKHILKLDVMLYMGLDAWDDAAALRFTPEEHLHAAGLKMFLDGSPQGRTAWMRQPYEGTPDYCGYGTMTDEAVQKAFEYAGEKGLQIIAHCNGDGAAEQFLRCLGAAEEKFPNLKTLRPVLIHGQLLGTDQLPRLRELGAMVSFFVAHTWHWGDVHLRNFGDRALHISPAASAKRAGVPFTFHQDAPVIQPDMMETVWCAVNRQTKGGAQLSQDESVSVADALRAITVEGAYQYGLTDRIGTLEAGKQADLVILSRDPMTAPKETLREIRAEATYKNGSCVYQRG